MKGFETTWSTDRNMFIRSESPMPRESKYYFVLSLKPVQVAVRQTKGAPSTAFGVSVDMREKIYSSEG